MKKYLIVLILLFATSLYAAKMPAPPPLRDEPPEETAYLRTIYDNINRVEMVSSNPDGVRVGKKGEMVVYESGSGTLEINIDGNKMWRGVVLIETP